jgi:hypothetical protein
MRAKVITDLRDTIERMVIRDGERKILLGGCWIVAGTAQILKAVACRIAAALGQSLMNHVGMGAVVSNVGGSASISGVWGSASISNVWGSASISDVGPKIKIENDNRIKTNMA